MSNEYVLADDLSGALEAGAAFLMRGRRVTLQLGEAGRRADASDSLVLHSSETRSARGAEAYDSVRQFLSRQKAGRARLLFKKIDSTLRGPVGAELKAVIDELAPPLVVLCPATPAVGRTVRDGLLLVQGVPVSDTEFRSDPSWPVMESGIAAVLAKGGVGRVALLSLSQLRSVGTLDSVRSGGVLVSDAETEDDLERLVALVVSSVPGAVFVGAGGLAHALATSVAGAANSIQPDPVAVKSMLFVCGSLKEKSRKQLELLRDIHHVPLHEMCLEDGPELDLALRLERSLAERGCASLAVAAGSRPADRSEPVRKLAAVIRLMATRGSIPEMLAATGGETAQALCAALEIQQLELLSEVQRGVVVSRTIGRESRLPKFLVIKPGGFGSDDVWGEIISRTSDLKVN